jgi:hypothetical protein
MKIVRRVIGHAFFPTSGLFAAFPELFSQPDGFFRRFPLSGEHWRLSARRFQRFFHNFPSFFRRFPDFFHHFRRFLPRFPRFFSNFLFFSSNSSVLLRVHSSGIQNETPRGDCSPKSRMKFVPEQMGEVRFQKGT